MNTDLSTKAKNYLKNIFFKLVNNAGYGKAMESVRKHRNIKLVTTEKRKTYLLSELNYHTMKFFTENLLPIVMKKTEIYTNKSVCLG